MESSPPDYRASGCPVGSSFFLLCIRNIRYVILPIRRRSICVEARHLKRNRSALCGATAKTNRACPRQLDCRKCAAKPEIAGRTRPAVAHPERCPPPSAKVAKPTNEVPEDEYLVPAPAPTEGVPLRFAVSFRLSTRAAC